MYLFFGHRKYGINYHDVSKQAILREVRKLVEAESEDAGVVNAARLVKDGKRISVIGTEG